MEVLLVQALHAVLEIGGARHLRNMKEGNLQGGFWSSLPKNRRCTCTHDTAVSLGLYHWDLTQAFGRGFINHLDSIFFI